MNTRGVKTRGLTTRGVNIIRKTSTIWRTRRPSRPSSVRPDVALRKPVGRLILAERRNVA